MSTQTRAGIRAARTLLSLIEENSVEDFEAAEAILSGEKDLTDVLQLLRRFKEHEEEPLSVERLREIVRRELVSLHFSVGEMANIVHEALGRGLRTPPGTTAEAVVDRALRLIDTEKESPKEQVDALIALLIASADLSELKDQEKIAALLRDLAIQALTGNLVMFPTLHSLARLRTRWTEEPLPYTHQEPRQRLVTRLLTDAERLQPENLRKITVDLLRAGLRGPADAEIAAVRRMKPKKAHGE